MLNKKAKQSKMLYAKSEPAEYEKTNCPSYNLRNPTWRIGYCNPTQNETNYLTHEVKNYNNLTKKKDHSKGTVP